ncbi:MAG: hypothetical protein KAV69_06880 [Deltaproteobacteria bacterium]|nr:hypothetical protein [Deltaproteobacteria bacterium]
MVISALAMMVLVLLYLPCLATVATIKQETGSFKWKEKAQKSPF